MGCGCSGGSRVPGLAVASSRVTVYVVEVDGVTVAEFGSLPEARVEAVNVNGRVKVTSKMAG